MCTVLGERGTGSGQMLEIRKYARYCLFYAGAHVRDLWEPRELFNLYLLKFNVVFLLCFRCNLSCYLGQAPGFDFRNRNVDFIISHLILFNRMSYERT